MSDSNLRAAGDAMADYLDGVDGHVSRELARKWRALSEAPPPEPASGGVPPGDLQRVAEDRIAWALKELGRETPSAAAREPVCCSVFGMTQCALRAGHEGDHRNLAGTVGWLPDLQDEPPPASVPAREVDPDVQVHADLRDLLKRALASREGPKGGAMAERVTPELVARLRGRALIAEDFSRRFRIMFGRATKIPGPMAHDLGGLCDSADTASEVARSVPALLDEIERLSAERDKLMSFVDEYLNRQTNRPNGRLGKLDKMDIETLNDFALDLRAALSAKSSGRDAGGG